MKEKMIASFNISEDLRLPPDRRPTDEEGADFVTEAYKHLPTGQISTAQHDGKRPRLLMEVSGRNRSHLTVTMYDNIADSLDWFPTIPEDLKDFPVYISIVEKVRQTQTTDEYMTLWAGGI